MRSGHELLAQRNVSGKIAGDHAGHLVGHRFLGDQGDINLVAQNGNLNLGAYKTIENEVAAFIDAGAEVDFNVNVRGRDANGRPTAFDVEFTARAPGTNNVIHANGSHTFLNQTGETYSRLDRSDIVDLVSATLNE